MRGERLPNTGPCSRPGLPPVCRIRGPKASALRLTTGGGHHPMIDVCIAPVYRASVGTTGFCRRTEALLFSTGPRPLTGLTPVGVVLRYHHLPSIIPSPEVHLSPLEPPPSAYLGILWPSRHLGLNQVSGGAPLSVGLKRVSAS